jgi:methyl-accepting chemotaxis protein
MALRDEIGELNDAIGRQTAMIDSSSAAVAQMITATDNVAKRIEGRRDSLSTLAKTIEEENNKSTHTFELIEEVAKSVDSIEEISDSGSSLSESFAENARSYRELSSALEETMADMSDLRSGSGGISDALKG